MPANHHAPVANVALPLPRVTCWEGGVLGLWGGLESKANPSRQMLWASLRLKLAWGVPGLKGAQDGWPVHCQPPKEAGLAGCHQAVVPARPSRKLSFASHV